MLNSREEFDRIKHIISEKAEIGDVQRAAEFYQLIRYSYASGCDSFGGRPHSMWSNFPLIEQASRRLQRVIIENRDFEKLISAQDSEVSFFYCDPPYYATESYYENVGFTRADHERLRNALAGISGKFLVSYNDCEEIYANGQVIFVKQCNSVELGQVGIFSIDNEVVVKIYDEQMPAESDIEEYTDSNGNVHSQVVLRSYNSEWEPRLISPYQEFHVLGRVLN